MGSCAVFYSLLDCDVQTSLVSWEKLESFLNLCIIRVITEIILTKINAILAICAKPQTTNPA